MPSYIRAHYGLDAEMKGMPDYLPCVTFDPPAPTKIGMDEARKRKIYFPN